ERERRPLWSTLADGERVGCTLRHAHFLKGPHPPEGPVTAESRDKRYSGRYPGPAVGVLERHVFRIPPKKAAEERDATKANRCSARLGRFRSWPAQLARPFHRAETGTLRQCRWRVWHRRVRWCPWSYPLADQISEWDRGS